MPGRIQQQGDDASERKRDEQADAGDSQDAGRMLTQSRGVQFETNQEHEDQDGQGRDLTNGSRDGRREQRRGELRGECAQDRWPERDTRRQFPDDRRLSESAPQTSRQPRQRDDGWDDEE